MLNLDSSLGIDIRDGNLVLATIGKGVREFALKRLTLIRDYRELDPSVLGDKVRQHVRSNGFNHENVILGLARDQVIVRSVGLPLEAEENLDQVVRFQVEKFEPSEHERSYYDYAVLDRNEKEKKIVLQVVMVRRTLVDEYLNLFRELNLYPAAIRFSSIGLAHLLTLHADSYPKKEPAVIVDINRRSFELMVVVNRNKFFSEQVARQQEEPTFEEVISALNTFLSRLELPGDGLSKIYLCGPLAPGLLESFQERFEDCELLLDRLQLRQIEAAPGGRALEQPGDNPWVAVGLGVSGVSRRASAGFNLIPEEKRVFGRRPSLIPTYVLAGLLVILMMLALAREQVQQQNLLSRVETQIAGLQSQVDQAMSLREEIDQKKAQLDEIRDLLTDRQQILALLKDLTERIPEHSYVSNIQIQGERVNVNGFSDSASSLVSLLQDSSQVKSVESRGIARDPRVNKDRFQLEIILNE
ncbi:MAG: PilN domain-containing protein [Acidobacteriota bacterium]